MMGRAMPKKKFTDTEKEELLKQLHFSADFDGGVGKFTFKYQGATLKTIEGGGE